MRIRGQAPARSKIPIDYFIKLNIYFMMFAFLARASSSKGREREREREREFFDNTRYGTPRAGGRRFRKMCIMLMLPSGNVDITGAVCNS